MKKFIYLVSLLMWGHAQAKIDTYAHEARKHPIAFSVVREDSSQDLELIKRFFPDTKDLSMVMVASGGCTAALLAAQAPLQQLTLVDPNKSQLDLTKLKVHLLSLQPEKRLAILGYRPMPAEKRKKIIAGYMEVLDIDASSFGSLDEAAEKGLDFIGRYEQVFEELRRMMSPQESLIKHMFSMSSLEAQIASLAPKNTLGSILDRSLDIVMSQNNLVAIFGEKATANRVQDFSKHFAQQIRRYTNNHLASSSPWLAHMLLGKFYEDDTFPWLTTSPIKALPAITYAHEVMNNTLLKSSPGEYHIIHLSNIIDWLSHEEAQETLSLAYKALKPGGIVVIRQLNSNIDIPELNADFMWDTKTASELLYEDRSFFYRNLFVGIKPATSEAPEVKALADKLLQEKPIIKGSFFNNLDTMDKETFQKTQKQFFFAVDYFSRPMSALIARLPQHKDRIDILENIVEEHGHFDIKHYHSNSFKQFLASIDVSEETMEQLIPSAPINMFNYTLMGICAHEDPLVAIACNGIIEYAFSDISALIAEKVVEREWVAKKDLVHYNLHAYLDKKHAEDFFRIVEPYMKDQTSRNKIISGLTLGVYIFNRLYEDLYAEALGKTTR